MLKIKKFWLFVLSAAVGITSLGCSPENSLSKPTPKVSSETVIIPRIKPIPVNNSPLKNNNIQMEESTSVTVKNATLGWNKNLKVNDVEYDLYIPKNYNNTPNRIFPAILVLPGWNFPRTSWIQNTKLVDYAEKYGYALILPEMGKTLYESTYYPETQSKWNAMPGGEFIKLFIWTIQQQHNLLQPGQYNTLLGLSTGGRGVALIALENPGLFVAGASLSGDFSQENTPSDRLMTAVYGAFKKFPQRWLGRDNPQARVKEWKMPLYLAHGTADNIVPESQSRLFYNTLKQYHQGNIMVVYHPVVGAEHNYTFWGGQLEEVFKFFAQQPAKYP